MSSSPPNHPAPGFPLNSTLAELRSQVLERARQAPAPTRARRSAQTFVVGLVALLVPLLVFFRFGGIRSAPRPSELVLATALGSALLALAVALIALGRGRSMLGRSRPWLAAVALLTPALLFAWRVLASSRYQDMMVEWSARPGFRCLYLSGVLSIVPLAALLWLRRGSDPVHPYLSAAALGASVGAGGWVLVDLWCPVGFVPHVLLGHVLPLVFVIGVSALVGGRILALGRARDERAARP